MNVRARIKKAERELARAKRDAELKLARVRVLEKMGLKEKPARKPLPERPNIPSGGRAIVVRRDNDDST